MDHYYLLTGLEFPGSNSVSTASTCATPSAPSNGKFKGDCADDSTMYSGWTCDVLCDSGYAVNGSLKCVGGTIFNDAECHFVGYSISSSLNSLTIELGVGLVFFSFIFGLLVRHFFFAKTQQRPRRQEQEHEGKARTSDTGDLEMQATAPCDELAMPSTPVPPGNVAGKNSRIAAVF